MSYYYYTGNRSLLSRDYLVGKTLTWYSTDSKEAYEENIDLIDPAYKTKEITYKFNSLGYRSREFNEVDKDNFFLVMGCSFTEGIGLALEDTWADITAKNLAMDYINLAIGGSGLYTVLHNTVLYVTNLDKYPLPKFVIVQHSQLERDWGVNFISSEKKFQLETVFREIDNRDFVVDGDNDHCPVDITLPFKNGVYTDIITQMWNSVNVPVIHWTYTNDGVNHIARAKLNPFISLDKARDNQHDGVKTNKVVADSLASITDSLLKSKMLYEPYTPIYVSNEQDKDVHDTHEGSPGTDRNGPSGTYDSSAKLNREEQLKKRIEALRKRDPFIYR